MLNKVLLIGNLTKDPDKPREAGSSVVTDLRIAVSDKFSTRDGEQKERTLFIDVVAWGRLAENCAKYLEKGRSIFVEGRLELDEWEKDGEKRQKYRVVANNIQFLPRGGERPQNIEGDSEGEDSRPAGSSAGRKTDGGRGASYDSAPPKDHAKLKDYGLDNDIPF